MFKLGKFLFGLAVAGAAAATVYNYLDEKSREDVDEFEDDQADDAEDLEEDDTAERIKSAANRTYTTIKTGSADAMAKV